MRILTLTVLLGALATGSANAQAVGSYAPALEASDFLNVPANFRGWADLRGRVILLERWATT